MSALDWQYEFGEPVAAVRTLNLPDTSLHLLRYLLDPFHSQRRGKTIVELRQEDAHWVLLSLGQRREQAPTPDSLIPGVVRRFHRFIRQYSSQHLFAHASAVQLGPGALVLLGEPNSGKTSLTLLACRQGAPLLADDLLALDAATGAVVPYPRPLCFNMDTLAQFPTEAEAGVSLPGAGLWYWRAPQVARAPAPIRWLVTCVRDSSVSAELTDTTAQNSSVSAGLPDTTAHEALHAALWASPQLSSRARLAITRAATEHCRHLILRYRDINAAARLLESLP